MWSVWFRILLHVAIGKVKFFVQHSKFARSELLSRHSELKRHTINQRSKPCEKRPFSTASTEFGPWALARSSALILLKISPPEDRSSHTIHAFERGT